MDSSERIWRETRLREAVLRGDQYAWDQWYQEAFDPLYRYVRWRCGGQAEEAEEVIQETWLIAVRRIGSFSPARASFVDWLRGIAANVVRSRLRRRLRRAGFVSLAEAPCPSDGRMHAAARDDQAWRVAEALGRLPHHYEHVLRAKYVDGMSVAEIADRLGQSPKAAESLLTRARRAFREAYRQTGENDG